MSEQERLEERRNFELAVVGSVITRPERYPELAQIITAEAIRFKPAQILWETVGKLIADNTPVTFASIHKALGQEGIRRIGGAAKISEVASCDVPNPDWHADQLRILALTDKAIKELQAAASQVVGDDDIIAAIDAAYERVARLKEQAESSGIVTRKPRRIVLTPASQIQMRRTRWLWDTTPEGAPPTSQGRIPMNCLTIGAGGAGIGKSQFCAWLTARITRGELPGELFGKPRCVMYAATEDSWAQTIAPRMVAAGADLDRVFRVDVEDDGRASARLTLPVDTHALGKTAEEYGVALLVADPLLSLIDSGINDYRQREVRDALEPLVAAADRHGFGIFGLAHFTKSGDADPLNRVSGSGAFGQLIRALVAFARVEDDDADHDFVLSIAKNNLGREGLPSYKYSIVGADVDTGEDGISHTSRFVLGPQTSTSVKDQMQASSQPAGDKETTTEAADWLKGYLVDLSGTDSSDVIKKAAARAGFNESAIDRAKRKLGITAKQSGFGAAKRSYWSLPAELMGAGESR